MNALSPILPAADTGPVALAIRPDAARFSLRIDPSRRAEAAAAFGLALPAAIGEATRDGTRRALCLGPDEWMLSADMRDAETIAAAFAALYDEVPHSLVAIGDREIAIELRGAEAATLLSVGYAADIEDLAIGSGTRTVFDGVQAVLFRDGAEHFTLEVWRSFLPHVLDLLRTANEELATGL